MFFFAFWNSDVLVPLVYSQIAGGGGVSSCQYEENS